MNKKRERYSKPYAGNPHVRFDEEEVASTATPRCGSILYMIKSAKGIVAAIVSFVVCAASAAKIEIAQDHTNALYKIGEVATFTVTVKDDNGDIIKEGFATWTLDNFGKIAITSGKSDLAAGNPFCVTGSLNRADFMRLRVSSHKKTVTWGVGYDVDNIRQDEPCPADFDEYWIAEKARLEREVPLDQKMTLDEKLSKRAYNCYRVNFATFNGKRTYGLLCVPKDSSKAPFRVRVSVPGAGPGFVSASTRPDEITLVMNVHAFEAEESEDAQRQHMQRQNDALAAKYDLPDKNAYCGLAGIAESREDYWYHDIMLGINRAVDWVCARPDVDLGQVIYTGSSQGGGFGLFLAYLNGHFTKSFVAVCAITGHYGYRHQRKSGWPFLIAGQHPEKRDAAKRNAAYFDGVNFAARIRIPIRFVVGFADEICPPANVYSAYNVCPSNDKAIFNAIGSTHNWYSWYDANRRTKAVIDFDAWLRAKQLPQQPKKETKQ